MKRIYMYTSPNSGAKQAEFEIRSCPNCIGEEYLCVSVYCSVLNDSFFFFFFFVEIHHCFIKT